MPTKRSLYPVTPDGRYFLVRDRLWRCTNPFLPEADKQQWVSELMAARRAKKKAMEDSNTDERDRAKQRIDAAKVALGERGPAWWTDEAPDLNRHLAKHTPYAGWAASIEKTLGP